MHRFLMPMLALHCYFSSNLRKLALDRPIREALQTGRLRWSIAWHGGRSLPRRPPCSCHKPDAIGHDHKSVGEISMFVDLQNKYDWVLQPVVGYSSVDRLIEVLEDKVVRPAEVKFNELLARRTNELRVKNI